MQKKSPGISAKYPKPINIVIIIAASIFITEGIVMFFLPLMKLPYYAESVIDPLILTAFIYPTLYYYIYRPMTIYIEESAKLNEQLEKTSQLDGLTGIYNRYYFEKTLSAEWRRAIRNKTPVSLIMCDIDFFKIYNDTYGHLIGDDCLKKVAMALNSTLMRAGDFIARYGGEEFAVVLPNTSSNGASIVGKRLHAVLDALEISTHSPIGKHLTVSFGIATVNPANTAVSETALISAADKALYKSKNNGRNRISLCVMKDETFTPPSNH